MIYKLETDASEEIVSLSVLKKHLRLDEDDSSEDEILSLYIKSARNYAQSYTGRKYGRQIWRIIIPEFVEKVRFPPFPVTSVNSVKYINQDNNEVILTENSYSFDPDKNEFIFLSGFTSKKITITAAAGIETVKPSVMNAALLLCGIFYENREGISDSSLKEIPFGVKNLLNTDRIL